MTETTCSLNKHRGHLNVHFLYFRRTRFVFDCRETEAKKNTSSNIHYRFVHLFRSRSFLWLAERDMFAITHSPTPNEMKLLYVSKIAVCEIAISRDIKTHVFTFTKQTSNKVKEGNGRGRNYTFTIQYRKHISHCRGTMRSPAIRVAKVFSAEESVRSRGARSSLWVLWFSFRLGIEFHNRTEEISARLALFHPTAELFAWIISWDASWLRWQRRAPFCPEHKSKNENM